ncbi:tripartite tricarboxylate transporter substrate binding protein [Bradyrhizobium sp. NP1]|uniref:Bug family tripartite tricarboxylate transporter substrate binding protein n=1 Tax=Bradyrhizobium sp. NP1 TaxID=3049772 RepID=UPI0025A5D90A|nr:tripartite tricarboxylate transporter substrate binding protein [Bradyrhizobium sp. NP1]WJR80339.1 tripartite tricarboxylate transporter substrate binding protein [Bradyrhizobium sp. NP1]
MKCTMTVIALASISFGTMLPLHAGDYPDRPIQIVVPFTAGGNTDTIARLIADKMQSSLKQPVVVVDKPGAGTNIGAEYVASSDPDGYRMLINAPASFVINQFIFKRLEYDPDTAFAPVCLPARVPNVLVVHPSLGVTTIQQLIDKIKANPGAIQYATAGIGTTSHLSGALFAAMAGLDTTSVPYKGTSQSVTDLVAGRVGFTIDNIGPILPFIKSGQLIALGVSTKDPVDALPNIPPINTVLKGYELSPWNALVMPAKTPDNIVQLVGRECDRIVHLPDVAEKIKALGSDPVGGSPEELAAFLKAERPKWEAAIKAAKIPKL